VFRADRLFGGQSRPCGLQNLTQWKIRRAADRVVELLEPRVLLSGTETPYLGQPVDIATSPVLAVNFDNGGEGIAYHDNTPQNINGQYRPNDAVDINKGSSVGPSGFSVGYTAPGEWLNYTINVSQSGYYTFHATVANSGRGGTFHMDIDGGDFTGEMTVPNSGPWDTWTTISSKAFALTSGTHVMRIAMDQPGYWGNIGDFDSFSFVRAS